MSLLGAIPGIDSFGQIGQALANPYGLPGQGKWNLTPGAFIGKNSKVTTTFYYLTGYNTGAQPTQNPGFLQSVLNVINRTPDGDINQRTGLDTVSDSGGRRLAVFEYPYRDGQDLMDMGRKGEKYTFNIFFYGQNYQVLMQEFIKNVFNTNENGNLTHPTRGTILVRPQEYTITHKSSEWNACNIQATFMEDQVDTALSTLTPPQQTDSLLRSALQAITSIQTDIKNLSFLGGAILNLPHTLENALTLRYNSIANSVLTLLSAIATTFGTTIQVSQSFADASNAATNFPVTYQVGFTPGDQQAIVVRAQQLNQTQSQTITPSQIVYQVNQVNSQIQTEINLLNQALGNNAYNLVIQYKAAIVALQQAAQAAIAQSQGMLTSYVVPSPMSLRQAAFNVGLSPDQQDNLTQLNPDLASVNYVPAGTVLVVPVNS